MKKEYEGVKYEPTYNTNLNKDSSNKSSSKKTFGKDSKGKNTNNKGRGSINQTQDNASQSNSKSNLYKNYQNSKFFVTTPVVEEQKESYVSRYKYILIMVALVVAAVTIMIVAFQKAYVKNTDNQSLGSSNTTKTMDGRYNTQTAGVVKDIDDLKGTITFYDIKESKEYTVNFDDATYIYNKYDKALTMDQIEIGEIMDIYYDNTTNRADKLKISPDAWEYKGVKNLVVNQAKKEMAISSTNYKYNDSIIIASEDSLVTLMDINNKDELIVKGYNKQIYSIIVDKGHGYIKLTNYEDFVGGTVEVGRGIIMPIVENMLIVATEGDYKLTMTNGDFVGSKSITVLRDEEITVDMGDFIKPATKNASVDFDINPNGADLYINDKLTDYDEAVKLDYGEYNIQVELSGYNTYTGKLTVDSPSMTIAVDLVETSKEDADEDSSSSNSNSDDSNTSTDSSTNTDNSSSTDDSSSTNNNSNTDTNSNSTNNSDSSTSDSSNNSSSTDTSTSLPKTVDADHTITVQGPQGAEVYLDGTLKGTAPATFIKVIGTHSITLRKSGYINKSYTVVIQDDSENVSFSFPELILSVN